MFLQLAITERGQTILCDVYPEQLLIKTGDVKESVNWSATGNEFANKVVKILGIEDKSAKIPLAAIFQELREARHV